MDKVHKVDEKPWIAKKKLNIKSLLEERNVLLKINNVDLSCGHRSAGEHFNDLSEKIGHFVDSNAQDVKSYFRFNLTDEKFLTQEPNCRLKLYQLQLEHAKKMISDRSYKVKYLTSLKTTRKEMLMRYLASFRLSENASDVGDNHLSITTDDCRIAAILVIQIWHKPNKHEKVRMEKEILLRSDQNLVALRDQFKCHRDYGVPIDLSEDPDQQVERIFHGELFKSGFLLIENTFYNDMRDPNNIDLSALIITWAEELITTVGEDGRMKRVSRGVGPFNRKRMEDTKLEDLDFRLGYPYLYCHQGNCEHLFTISDIRYVPLNKLEPARYPAISACSIGRKEYDLKCYMCRLRPPHWYTRNNSRLPLDPYFFCENCFRSFNYDKDKKKIGNFQAFLYTSSYGIPDSIVMSTSLGRDC